MKRVEGRETSAGVFILQGGRRGRIAKIRSRASDPRALRRDSESHDHRGRDVATEQTSTRDSPPSPPSPSPPYGGRAGCAQVVDQLRTSRRTREGARCTLE